MKTPILALAAVLAFTACSQTKQLEEMHDSTKEMNETTKDMNQTTTHLDAQMSAMKEITKGLCRGSSQALPLQARQMTLAQMDRAAKGDDKMNWAVTYLEGFDFQVWPLCQASESEVDHMLDDAVLEFLQVAERYDNQSLPNPFVETANVDEKGDTIDDADSRDLSFNTISLALSYTNRHQLDNHDKDATAPVYNFLTIIENTLLEGEKVKRGERANTDLKQYQRDLLAKRDVAVKLLQARQQMSAAVVVGMASKVAVGGLKNTTHMALDRYMKLFKIQPKPWQFVEDSWTDSMLDRYAKLLGDAANTRAFLKSIGEKPSMNKNLTLLVTSMQPMISKNAIKSLTKESKIEHVAFLKSLKALKASL